MTLSNSEKQERFRKKEDLKKFANEIFKNWQLTMYRDSISTPPLQIRERLDRIIELPSGWTDEDYKSALERLNRFSIESFIDDPKALDKDVETARDSIDPFFTSNNPTQWKNDNNLAKFNMKKLSNHIFSAMELIGGKYSDFAAAIIDVERKLGYRLINEKKVPKSNATTLCLLLLSDHIERPEWFVDELSTIFKEKLGERLSCELGKKLISTDNK